MTKFSFSKKGFTLLEILLVVGIISILAGIVILALNPSKQLGDTRNAQRRSDVLTILNSVYQYSIDNNGGLDEIVDGDDPLEQSETCDANGTDAMDLTDSLIGDNAKYIVEIPTDPNAEDPLTDSEYYVTQSDNTNRITVCAPNTENTENGVEVISVTR